ncbi:ADP-ribosylglycohydrolase family protein [Amnibacterium flavum]|uniref:ADP-ribosylglycohydrolase family protein n=1 Tax=Amnibacterium flavum TaxID=2173173 RepID=UPI00362AAA20
MPPTPSERARGCLIGLAVGDAMGAPTEGMTRQQVAREHGRITTFTDETATGTDDTEYAVLTARAVIRRGADLTGDDVAADWLTALAQQTDGYHGAGFSEMGALAALRSGVRPPLSGRRCAEAWSDGAAMRAAPLGIAAAGDPARAAELAEADGAVSHSRDGIDGARAIAAAVSVAMTGADTDAVLDAARAAVPDVSWTARTVDRALAIVAAGGERETIEQRLYDEISILGYPWADSGPEATAFTLAAVALAQGDPIEAILTGVNMGRDSDTIAAMAGAITGAMAGIDAFPPEWVDRVRLVHGVCVTATRGADLLRLADDLTEVGR